MTVSAFANPFLDSGYWKTATVESIKSHIKNGADINARNEEYDETPLMLAAWWNETPDVISTLIKSGADVNDRTSGGWTALMSAASNNKNLDVIMRLIKNGADVNSRTKSGWTALMSAASNNKNPNVVLTLIKKGVDVNNRNNYGETPLIWAASENENPDVITTLIKNGAYVNARDIYGKTAWDYMQDNEYLKDTKAYWVINDKRFLENRDDTSWDEEEFLWANHLHGRGELNRSHKILLAVKQLIENSDNQSPTPVTAIANAGATKPETPKAEPQVAKAVQQAPNATPTLAKLNENLNELENRMDADEMDEVREQIAQCWNVPVGLRNIEDMVVEIAITVNPDKTVASANLIGDWSGDNFSRSFAESALRAIQNPECSPLNLPDGKFELWRNITFVFNANDMLGY